MIKMHWYLLCIGLLTDTFSSVAAAATSSGHPELPTLSYFEMLNYDPSSLVTSRSSDTRGTQEREEKDLRLSLECFNRTFLIALRPHEGVFWSSVKFMVNHQLTTEYDPVTFYEGELEDEEGSKVVGHILDGIFDGTIRSQNGTYHVERVHKFFKSPQSFHSIIYHERDIIRTPDSSHFSSHTAAAAAKETILEQLRETASQAVPLTEKEEDQEMTSHPGQQQESRRLKRGTVNGNRFCLIRLAADHLFLENIGNGSVVNTMAEMVTVIEGVQEIYRSTDFINDDGIADGIKPVVASLEVLNQSAEGYPFNAEDIDVISFLELWSQEDQGGFCLSLLLTYRDFDSGVLGLAFVGDPPGGNRGGICEEKVLTAAFGEAYLNTAIVSFLNFGQRQPRLVSTITVAHEFGHNFGAVHDPLGGGVCSPGAPSGNFIMFPQVTDGSLPNNNMFSSCSISRISAVLEANSACFTNTETFCGNGILEEGEQCDCGQTCELDPCCLGDTCTLTPGSQCSSLDSCCSSSCQFQPGVVCLEESECSSESRCLPPISEGSSLCPGPSLPKANGTFCDNNQSLCLNGVCSSDDVCVRNGARICQCTGPDESQLCHVCCVEESSGQCVSSFSLFGAAEGEFKPGGAACNDFLGLCTNDSPPRCTSPNSEETLEDLLDLFNGSDADSGDGDTGSGGVIDGGDADSGDGDTGSGGVIDGGDADSGDGDTGSGGVFDGGDAGNGGVIQGSSVPILLLSSLLAIYSLHIPLMTHH